MRCAPVLSLLISSVALAFPDSPVPKERSEGEHWAFVMPGAREVRGEGHSVDGHSVDGLLVSGDLEPVGEASREVLLRRAWYVVTGLLPTEEQWERWLADGRTGEAWMRGVVEEALAQPAFGERWARHWLDVARYADTKGAAITDSEDYPYAYTYRDWVIGAFNADLPYDEFVHRQVAADLMGLPVEEEAALGFLTVGREYQGGLRHLVVADQIDVTMRGFMGLTVACARCHDHKSDPIPTADFYSLYGVFASADMPAKLPVIREPEDSPGYREFLRKRLELAEAVHGYVKECLPDYERPEDALDFHPHHTRKLNQTQRDKFRGLVGKVTKFEAGSPFAPARAMVVREGAKAVEPYVFERGNPSARGEVVPRRFLKILREKGEVFEEGSGRLELAHRLTDERNPLTARVWANRVWMHVMGSPLVDSPGEFGVETEVPLQLAVLDHLAIYLVENGWSTKALIAHVMTSEAWRRESGARAEDMEVDPENRYFMRANRVRKDLEGWRDTALQVSGELDLKMGGTPVALEAAPFTGRRTIYGKVRRGYLESVMRAFDFPGSEEALMRRSETTTPMQALYLMNSPVLHEQARALASGVEIGEEGLKGIYGRVLRRDPRADEMAAALGWLARARMQRTAGPWEYGYVREGSMEFMPYDHFVEGSWRGGRTLPDPVLGYLHWSSAGGHPELDKATVLKWRSMEAGELRLEGRLNVPTDKGNGVRGRLMRSDGEVLGEWPVGPAGEVSTEVGGIVVGAGEELWFVVDSRGDQGFDSFQWSPRLMDGAEEVAHAASGFCGPGLEPMAQLAQVLLLSNEFFFID
ncbi:MAG: DUF1549 and DUF1553 domain-containing protein [Verrucomicrobiaceae bacterium]